jgi:hypothetical protein
MEKWKCICLNRAAKQRVQGRSVGQRGCVVLRDIGISEYHAAVATDSSRIFRYFTAFMYGIEAERLPNM